MGGLIRITELTRLFPLGLLAIIAFGFSYVSAEDYSDWNGHQRFYLNTTPLGANVPSDQFNFTVLIKLNSLNFNGFAACKPIGADVRFSGMDGAGLPFEIEAWDDVNQSAVIWVNVPVVYGNNGSQYITMHYDNDDPEVQSASNPSAVFDRANSFIGAWHLNDIHNIWDATTPQNETGNLKGTNSGTLAEPGQIGAGIKVVNGTWVELPPAALGDVAEGGVITVSLWAKGGGLLGPSKEANVFEATGLGNRQINAHIPWTDEYVKWDFGNAPHDQVDQYDRIEHAIGPSSYKGVWNYWVFTHNSTTGYMAMYKNGVLWKSANNRTKELGIPDAFKLGSKANGTQCYNGNIDEFVISKVERSADWIKLSYENQKDDQTLLSSVAASTLYVKSDGHGSVSINNNGTSFQEFGTLDATISAVPLSGYAFVNWSAMGPGGTVSFPNNEEESPTAAVRVENGCVVLVANFKMVDPVAVEPVYPNVCNIGDDMKVDGVMKVGVGEKIDEDRETTVLTVNGYLKTNGIYVHGWPFMQQPPPDYVFEKGYKLRPIHEVDEYIRENGHLPDVPSASEIRENGLELATFNMILLKKIEELTLYHLDSHKKLIENQNNLDEIQRTIEK